MTTLYITSTEPFSGKTGLCVGLGRRFLAEARSAASLDHTNVLTVHYVGKYEDRYFIEMDYADSGTVRSMLRKKGRLDAREAATVIRDAARGLAAAHSYYPGCRRYLWPAHCRCDHLFLGVGGIGHHPHLARCRAMDRRDGPRGDPARRLVTRYGETYEKPT